MLKWIIENRINGYLFELADKDFIGIRFLSNNI